MLETHKHTGAFSDKDNKSTATTDAHTFSKSAKKAIQTYSIKLGSDSLVAVLSETLQAIEGPRDSWLVDKARNALAHTLTPFTIHAPVKASDILKSVAAEDPTAFVLEAIQYFSKEPLTLGDVSLISSLVNHNPEAS